MTNISKMKQVGGFKLLPPPPDHCQTCAVKHEPGQPHDQQSFYYRCVFYWEHGRSPTWADAIAHCTNEVKAVWVAALAKFGITVELPNKSEEAPNDL